MRVVEPFSPLIVALMVFTSTNQKQYRVYSSEEEFVVVDADTASEAIVLSGIEKPFKLFHIIPNTEAILKDSQLRIVKLADPEPDAPEASAADADAAVEASQAQEGDVPAAETAPEEPSVEEIAVAVEEVPTQDAPVEVAAEEAPPAETPTEDPLPS